MEYWGGPEGMLPPPPPKLLGGLAPLPPPPPPPPSPLSSYAYAIYLMIAFLWNLWIEYDSASFSASQFWTVYTFNPLSANHNCSRRHSKIFFHCFSKKIRLDISCQSSARQRIHMKHQALFSLKDKSKKIKVWCAAVLV